MSKQASSEIAQSPEQYFLSGGGGFEGTKEASTFTFVGMCEMAEAYAEYRVAAAERAARDFHETYERLAPKFGYQTRRESALPWEDIADNHKRLMIAVCAEVLERAIAESRGPQPDSKKCAWTERCFLQKGHSGVHQTEQLGDGEPSSVPPDKLKSIKRWIDAAFDVQDFFVRRRSDGEIVSLAEIVNEADRISDIWRSVAAQEVSPSSWSEQMAQVQPCGHTEAQHMYQAEGYIKLDLSECTSSAPSIPAKAEADKADAVLAASASSAQEVSPPSPKPTICGMCGGWFWNADTFIEHSRKCKGGDTRELKAALRKHQHFVGLVLDSQVPEPGDLDGFSIEEFAIKCGFYVPTPVTEPCHEEACVCAELGFPTTCNRWSNSAQEAVKVCESERLLGEPTKE